MEEDDFLWLQQWYYSYCDGDWEHTYGVELKTCEDSSWLLRISLSETDLEKEIFQEINIKRSDKDWLVCDVKFCQFEGKCGPENVSEVLKIFRNWVETFTPELSH